MKMLTTTKGVTFEFFDTYPHKNSTDLFHKLTALKYDTAIFQEFRTQDRTHAY